jgi:hypothetical protein
LTALGKGETTTVVTPDPGPAISPTPRPTSGGNGPLVLLFVLVGLGFLLAVGGACAWLIVRARGSLRTDAATSEKSTRNLPSVTREVPQHRLSVLDGCSDKDVRTLVEGIDGAISVGAPLYNSGNFAGCYHLYSGTAADLERRVSSGCTGPVHALAAGRERAGSLDDPSRQAWAMRDAFDGLLDVVERREGQRPRPVVPP